MHPLFDVTFRFLLFALTHSLLATERCKELVQRRAPRLARWYRLSYNGQSAVLLAWVLAAWPTAPVLYVVPGFGYLLMRGGQLLMLIAIVRCLRQTGMATFLGLVPDEPGNLVTTGCYARVRHPLYLLSVLFLLCSPAPSAKWGLLTLLTTAYCLLASSWEEQRLRTAFGDAYRVYQQTVPAFIPRFGELRPRD